VSLKRAGLFCSWAEDPFEVSPHYHFSITPTARNSGAIPSCGAMSLIPREMARPIAGSAYSKKFKAYRIPSPRRPRLEV
jgi:hypothetical protein